jgi:hypothetical protein
MSASPKLSIRWLKGNAASIDMSEKEFVSVIGNKLLCRVVPSSPSPADLLKIDLSFRNAQWYSILAVEDSSDKVWYLFKNGNEESLGWVGVKYALKEFLMPKFDIVCEVMESADWFHTLLCMHSKKVSQENRYVHCRKAVCCLMGINKFKSTHASGLGCAPRDIVKIIGILVWQSKASRAWHVCDI